MTRCWRRAERTGAFDGDDWPDDAEMMSEQWEYRELLYQMTLRDLLVRYKQSVMGFGWAIFMPLVNTVVFTVIFTQVATSTSTPARPTPLCVYRPAVLELLRLVAAVAVNSLSSNASL
jgi:ABC-type polysaccharide/polyol phosphate export permease